MCGIAGIFDKINHRHISPQKLAILSQEIHHRGRDDVGYFTEPGVGFVHRRLSIIDPIDGVQPMMDESNHIVLTYNGMIYNFRELRQKLESVGHVFKTNSDTEVVLRSYIAWGTECVKYFSGFFAFAIYDKNREILFCARDPLGQKPLYYYIGDNSFFYFASELSALVEMLSFKSAISVSALKDYLTLGFNVGAKTLFQGLFRLEAGHSLVIKRNIDNLHLFHYAKKNLTLNEDNGSSHIKNYDTAKKQIAHLLEESVQKRLISDVPVGVLLSGGLDSGLITAIAAKHNSNIMAFTAGFADQNIDETEAAKDLAQKLGITHRTLTIDDFPESMIDDIAVISGEPFADAAILPLYLMCHRAKEDVKVLLCGDGGDEVFGGYARYPSFIRQEMFKGLFSLKTRQFFLQKLADCYPNSLKMPKYLRASATLNALTTDAAGGYLRNMSITPPNNVMDILSDYAKDNLINQQTSDHFIPYFKGIISDKNIIFDQARWCDINLWLADRMLPKTDRASMAASIEMRCPMLDLELVNYGLKIPYNFLNHKMGGKKILRDIAHDYLPSAHIMRPKQGFTMPLAHLLRTKWRNRLKAVIHDIALKETGLFNMTILSEMMYAHLKGHQDHSRILWAIIQLEAYLRIYKFI